jgi:hypothetical protein
MTPTQSMKVQIDVERSIARTMKAKADLWNTLANIVGVIFILGTVVAIFGSFDLVQWLLTK